MSNEGLSTPDTTTINIQYAHISNPQIRIFLRLIGLLLALACSVIILNYMLILPNEIRAFISSDPLVTAQFESFGLSFDLILILNYTMRLLGSFPFLTIVILVVLFRSDNWVALWLGFTALMLVNHIFLDDYLVITAHPLSSLFFFLIISSGMLLQYALPNGRFSPRWIVLLFIPYLYWEAARTLHIASLPVSFPLNMLPWVLIAIGAIVVQRNRYITGTPEYRQQVKWVLFGMFLFLIGNLIYGFVVFPLQDSIPVFRFLGLQFVGAAMYSAMGFGFLIAITRYRLYDINIAIHRSIVYGTVFIVLLTVFFGVTTLLQTLLGSENHLMAFVIAGIGPAMLFNPTRKRIQHVIDRRLYGFRFDLDQLKLADVPPTIMNPGLLTGRTLGDYAMLGVLGKGGMGEVYKAQGKGKTVAMKILPQQLALDPEFRKRFDREAQALRSLDHPNIVKLFDHGEAEGIHYMAIEFIPGDNLSDYMLQHGKLSLEDAANIGLDIASALGSVHALGLVHRDIKPSNIMLRPSISDGRRQAVLMDFGIAKTENTASILTGSGGVGTINYMAPEQIIEARTVDYRADIYALGVVMYEVYTGYRPFTGNVGQVLFAHLQQPPPDPRDYVDSLPSNIVEALLMALSKEPDERFQTVEAFAKALTA